jgi:hypothetical protein
MSKKNHHNKSIKKFFNCSLGYGIMWWRGLEYKDCPLDPSNRDMPECKECKLRIDKKWENNKQTWKEETVKKRKVRRKKIKGKRNEH